MSHIFETVTGTSGALAFKFNGQFALKNYTVEIVNGNRLKVVSTTNEMFSLLEADVSEIEINGTIYSDPTAAQLALTTLVHSDAEPVVLTKEKYMQLAEAVQSADRGKILPDTTEPVGGWQPGWYTPGLFENDNPGTNYPNQNDLKAKKGFITKFLFNGATWDFVEYEMPKTDFSALENIVFNKSTYAAISTTVINNGNAQAISGINDTPATMAGILAKIKGRFPAAGNLDLFIAKNKVGNAFTIGQLFTVAIPSSGLQELDISNLNIPINITDRVGVASTSTSKPYYGTDNTLGYGWNQNALTPVEGANQTFTAVSNAVFSFAFEVREVGVAKKAVVDLIVEKLITTRPLYTLPVLTGGNSAAFLANNVPAENDGIIKSIRLNAETAGIAQFQIVERISFNAILPAATDVFKVKKSFTINVTPGWKSYDLPSEVKISRGDYTAMTGGVGFVKTPLNNGSGINHLGWWQASAGVKTEGSTTALTFQNGSVLFEYVIESDNYQKAKTSVVNKITAVQNAENFNSIRNLVASITDAGPYNIYEIYIPAGIWNEYDWPGKKYVKMIGSVAGGTIINLDPKGTMASFVAPADIHFSAEAGKTLNNVNQPALHIIFLKDDIHCENLTFRAKNSKYPIHMDNPGWKKAYYKNCFVSENNCNYPIGIGGYAGQEIYFDACIPHSDHVGKPGFFYHNWNNQNAPNSVTFNRCKFDNCSYGVIDELGSNQIDFVNLFNCFTTLVVSGQKINFIVDKQDSTGKTFWKYDGINQEPNPVNVPYCIVLNTTGTKVTTLTSIDTGGLWPANTVQRDVNVIKNISIIEL